MNRAFKQSPSRRQSVIKGRPRTRKQTSFFQRVRLALATHKRRMTVKSRAAQLANVRRNNQRRRPTRKRRS